MSLFKKSPSVSMETVGFEGTDCTQNVRKSVSNAVYMRNFRITDDGKLEKRCGYVKEFCNRDIKGIFCGKIAGKEYFIYKKDAFLYAYLIDEQKEGFCYGINSEQSPVCFFFGGILYIVCKEGVLTFDQKGFFMPEPYIPTVAITAPNTGGGVLYEGINLLSDYAKILYSPDGESSDFVLPESALSVFEVFDGGVRVQPYAYSYNANTNTLSLNYVPKGEEANSLEVTFYFDNKNKDVLLNRSFCIYGAQSDSRVFAYGTDSFIYYSDVTGIGANPLYFPAENFIRVGDGQTVTSLCRHYGNLAVFTEKDAWYISVSSVDYDGYSKPSFPILPLNGAIGCIKDGSVLINNSPMSVNSNGVYLWSSTSLRDERNAKHISSPIQSILPSGFLSGCGVFDNESDGEVWLYKDSFVCVYNYRRGAWYFYDGIYAEKFYSIGPIVYFSNPSGLYRFDKNARTDDGEVYSALWESSFADFGVTGKKNIMRLFVSLIPKADSDVRITVIPNTGKRKSLGYDECFKFNVFSFSAIDFSDFTFECEARPAVIRRRLNLRGADSVKIRIEHDMKSTVTVDKLLLQASI